MRKTKKMLSKKDKSYFRAAQAVSTLSDFKRVNVGAVLIYKHRIASSSCNSQRTHPLQQKLNKERFEEETPAKLHAEVSCLLPLLGNKDIKWRDCELYVYREYKKGGLAMSRPCQSCQKLIKDLGIRIVHYTTDDGYATEEFEI